MVVKNGKAPARRKSASSSAKSSRSNSVSKGSVHSQHVAIADQLDGDINNNETTAVEGEAGDRILEEAGINDGASGDAVPAESVELIAITLHQPWASLVAAGKKHYETRSWATDYRGQIAIHAGKKFHEDKSLTSLLEIELNLFQSSIPLGAVVAIAELTDCILMSQEFINEQSSFEQYLGLWEPGRYAWKLENVRAIEPIPATGKQGLWKWASGELEKEEGRRKKEEGSWNPDDFGEVQHAIESDGQLNLLEWDVNEPPEPDDYKSIELFDKAYKQWEDSQPPQLEIEGQELCNTLMDGSIYAVELAQDSPMQESNCGEEAPTTFANGTSIVTQFLEEDTQNANADSATSKQSTLQIHNSAVECNLSLLHRLAPHSQLMESDSDLETAETASPTCLEQSETCSQNLPLSKTSPACSTVPIPPAINQEATLATSSTPYPRAGMTQNGSVFPQRTLEAPGVEKGSLLLRSPGALSTGNGRPPGKTRLESQLNQLVLIQDGEVANPEFLEAGYQLPIGFTNLQEYRTAIELSQVPQAQVPQAQVLQAQVPQAQQSLIDLKSELPAEMETTAIDVQPLVMPLTGESQPLDSNELNICLTLLPNIGALSKTELISAATEQHQLICVIERKEFELAIEKLHRVRLTGVYLQEFKKKCQYGEFENRLEQAGIGARSAQNYMTIAKNWEIVEAKTKLVALLAEENQPAIGLKWALETVRDEKKSLKSAAPPADPDCWRTPNTRDQPVVDLVKQALGGQIWLDPCASQLTKNVPAAVRYFKADNGLAEHQTWSKTVFINPPFSDPLPWVKRCCFEIARGSVSAAVMLLKVGTVSNVGTGELISQYASAVCHWRGRINFLNDEGNAVKGSDFDCVLVYFGDQLDLFRQAFSGRGTISTIDNHYSSVNKKYQLPESYSSVAAEQKQMAGAVGLSNGRSLLPDTRDRDRDLMDRHDPSTVFENMPTVFNGQSGSITRPEISTEIKSISAEFEQAKSDCLSDYITAISSNLSAFSDEQIAFLAKIINEESAKRIGF